MRDASFPWQKLNGRGNAGSFTRFCVTGGRSELQHIEDLPKCKRQTTTCCSRSLSYPGPPRDLQVGHCLHWRIGQLLPQHHSLSEPRRDVVLTNIRPIDETHEIYNRDNGDNCPVNLASEPPLGFFVELHGRALGAARFNHIGLVAELRSLFGGCERHVAGSRTGGVPETMRFRTSRRL